MAPLILNHVPLAEKIRKSWNKETDRLNEVVSDLQSALSSNQRQLRESRQTVLNFENKLQSFRTSVQGIDGALLQAGDTDDQLLESVLEQLRQHQELKTRYERLVVDHQDLTLTKNRATSSTYRLEREKSKLERDVGLRDKMIIHMQQRIAELFVKDKKGTTGRRTCDV